MKLNMISVIACLSLTSGVALAQPRDTTAESDDDDANRGLGGTRLAVDVDYADALVPNVGAGFGGSLRLGREYDLLVLSLTPELVGDLHTFSGTGDALQVGGMAGGRASIGKVIEPGVFAHIGAGHASTPGDSVTGLQLDLGLFVDLTLIPALDVGVHGAWDAITWDGEENFDWYRLGAHLAFAP
jgi:hypothetical protein